MTMWGASEHVPGEKYSFMTSPLALMMQDQDSRCALLPTDPQRSNVAPFVCVVSVWCSCGACVAFAAIREITATLNFYANPLQPRHAQRQRR
jgi:hypothetical protein